MSRYLTFTTVDTTGKTLIVHVASKANGSVLGAIRWYTPWRCYAFWPSGETVFNEDCLEEVTEHIHELMEARKQP